MCTVYTDTKTLRLPVSAHRGTVQTRRRGRQAQVSYPDPVGIPTARTTSRLPALASARCDRNTASQNFRNAALFRPRNRRRPSP
eukprot:917539-Rhodomonas_salina.3